MNFTNLKFGLSRLAFVLSLSIGPIRFGYLMRNYPKTYFSWTSWTLENSIIWGICGFFAILIIYASTIWVLKGFIEESPKKQEKT